MCGDRVWRTFLFSSSFLLVAAVVSTCSSVSAQAAARLSEDVVPTFEAIRLTIDPDRPDYSGMVGIDLEVRKSTDSFRLDSKDLQLGTMTLTRAGRPVEFRHQLSTEDGILTISSGSRFETGPLRLDIAFTNKFDTQSISLYRMETGGRGYVFTQFESDDAREAFPCWDEPEFKIPYQFTLEIPENVHAVTNTPIETTTTLAGHNLIVFGRTKPLPSYLLAIAVGPFEFVDVPGTSIPTRIVTVQGQSRLAGTAVQLVPPCLKALEVYFDRPYPFEKLDLIAVPEFWPGAMENPGAITFADNILLLDAGHADVSDRRRLARVATHEIAHMWFGDLVTMRWWDDLWLNESFADWMGDKITDQVYPEFKLPASELVRVQQTMASDARASTIAIRQPVEDADDALHNVGIAYYKGKRVLGMFEQWMGPEVFRKGVLDYLKAHEWGSAVAADLWAGLSKASGRDIGALMSTFTDQPGFPLVTAEIDAGGAVRLSQKRFSNVGTDLPDLQWKIPVGLKYFDGTSVHTTTVLLTGGEQTLDLKLGHPGAWVMPNWNARGYYRWNMPGALMLRLTTQSAASLDPLERIEVLSNAGALLDAGAIDGGTWLAIVSGFAKDPDPDVLSGVLEALQHIRQDFVTPELREPFAAYIRETLRPALRRIGTEPKPGEDESNSLLRPQLLTWLGRHGRDPDVLAFGKKIAAAFMTDPASVDPALAGVGLELAAVPGDQALFDEYRKHFEVATTPGERRRYLTALGAFSDTTLQKEALDYALNDAVRPNEMFQVSRGIPGGSDEGQALAFRWTIQNYDAIVSKIPPEFVAFMPFTAGGCSAARLEAGKAFFSDPAHRVPGTERELEQISEQVNDCVRLRQREGKSVAAYLNDLRNHRSD